MPEPVLPADRHRSEAASHTQSQTSLPVLYRRLSLGPGLVSESAGSCGGWQLQRAARLRLSVDMRMCVYTTKNRFFWLKQLRYSFFNIIAIEGGRDEVQGP